MTSTPIEAPATGSTAPSPVQRRRSRARPGPALLAGAGILLALVLGSLLVTLFPPDDPLASVAAPLTGPSGAHLLGTDNVGRDQLVRLLIGARSSLVISGAAALGAAVLGGALGLFTGYLGGILDAVVMRLVDAALALPGLLVALVVGVVLGNGALPLVVALGLVFAPSFARIVRAPVLVLRERDFVVAARIAGVPAWRIAVTHLLPNVATPLLVQLASVASNVVLLEAALSYLGMGVQAPDPSLGRMISEFTRFMQTQPLLIAAPSLLIVVLSAGWNLLADGVQDLISPRRDTGGPSSLTTAPTVVRTGETAVAGTDPKEISR